MQEVIVLESNPCYLVKLQNNHSYSAIYHQWEKSVGKHYRYLCRISILTLN